jgi:hypothetical protein
MPAANRFGPIEDAAPPVARQQPNKRRKDDPINRAAVRSRNLPREHRQLMA